MAKKATTTQAKAQDDKILQAQLDSLGSKIEGILDSIGLINERLSQTEINVNRCLPRESLVPLEVWSKIGHEELLVTSVKGTLEGLLQTVPLHQLMTENSRQHYATIVFSMAETMLLEYGQRLNQVVASEEEESQDE